MSRFLTSVRSFAGGEEGATYAEYVLLAVVIGLACIVAVGAIGPGVRGFFASVPVAS